MRRPDFQAVTANPERSTLKGLIISTVLLCDKIGHDLPLIVGLPHSQILRHCPVGFDRADTIDAADRCHNDHVIAFEQSTGGRVPHPVDLLVDLRFLLDIGVRTGDISFWLIIVVIADEIFDRIIRKEPFELTIKLSRQRLVRGKYDGRTLCFLDDFGHREGLARARRAEKNLVAFTAAHAIGQFFDRCRLVPGRRKLGLQDKLSPALQLFTGFHIRRGIGQKNGLFSWGGGTLGHVAGSEVQNQRLVTFAGIFNPGEALCFCFVLHAAARVPLDRWPFDVWNRPTVSPRTAACRRRD